VGGPRIAEKTKAHLDGCAALVPDTIPVFHRFASQILDREFALTSIGRILALIKLAWRRGLSSLGTDTGAKRKISDNELSNIIAFLFTVESKGCGSSDDMTTTSPVHRATECF